MAATPEKVMQEPKDDIHLVVIGHEGSGKSTTIGNLMYQKGGIDPLILQQYELEAIDINSKRPAKYAWVLNKLAADRCNNPLSFEPLSSRSLSLTSQQDDGEKYDNATPWRIETESRLITIIDAPGHPDFLQNMITGASQAHAALLVISAVKEEFSAGFSNSGQAREHLVLTHHLGVRELVIAINKLDEWQWSAEQYISIMDATKEILIEIGYNPDLVKFVPISGSHGDNLVATSKNLEWYEGWVRSDGRRGFSLLDAIDDIPLNAGSIKDGPFRLSVQDVFQSSDVGAIIVGKVECGRLVEGMDIILVPSQAQGKVGLIERRQTSVAAAGPGDRVGLHVEGLTSRQVRRGYVCCNAAADPLSPVKEFVAQIAVLPGASSIGCIKKGLKVRLDCHNTYAEVTFDFIYPREQSADGSSDTLNSGDVGCVKLVSDKQIALEIFSVCPSLGRFALRHKSHTIAVGLVIESLPN